MILKFIILYIPIFIQRIVDQYNEQNNYIEILFTLIGIVGFYYIFNMLRTILITFFQNRFVGNGGYNGLIN